MTTAPQIDVAQASVPGQQTHGGQPFPLVLACRTPSITLDETCTWIGRQRDELSRQAREIGAILFRGFPVATPEEFDRFIAAFGWANFPYEESLSNAVRVNKTPRVFTANEAPPETKIYLHHEMAQTPIHPSRLFFFCQQPAETGGATPICRSDVLWNRLASLHPQFTQDCEQKGLRYSHVMPGENDLKSGMGRSWQSTLRAETREAAEQRLTALKYDWTWQPDGSLRVTTPVLPAVRKLPDGRTTFFNQLIAAFSGWKDARNDPTKSITFGDDTPLDVAAAQTAAQLGEELSFDIPWQRGDVALVDNYVAMHGRRPYAGTRKVLASLIDVTATV